VSNDDFWKNRYKSYWGIAATKEEKVKTLIERECNCSCKDAGLGTGQTTFLSGTAKSRGFEKGSSDLHVEKTNIFVEVTGPNLDSVGKDAGLWVRPDKIEYAIRHPENDVWVVHVLQKDFFLRAIHLDEDFKKDYKNGEVKIVHRFIRGTQETMTEIPANSKHVVAFDQLCSAIKTALSV
jgi:hypothetical protein